MAGSNRFWPARAVMRRRHRLMRRMMRGAGIKPQDAARVDGGLAILEARTKCSYCEHEEACKVWLAEGAARRLPPGFCANARLFRTLLEACGPRTSH
jgi:Family of unknown function (DUF6455)